MISEQFGFFSCGILDVVWMLSENEHQHIQHQVTKWEVKGTLKWNDLLSLSHSWIKLVVPLAQPLGFG